MPETNAAASHVAIRRWREVPHSDQLIAGLNGIFFEASNTKSFSSEEAKEAFRERWFARYLKQYPQWAYVAQSTDDGAAAGYLVGALDEPSSLDDFAAAAENFPAHLHVNLAPQFRSRGIGAELIEAFAADAARAGVKGVHVVTSSDARNVHFYQRVGFHPRATASVNGHELVFLGRSL
ncbi:MAG: GNAT family N-acetyltransferase [Hyphomicrobium sp.]